MQLAGRRSWIAELLQGRPYDSCRVDDGHSSDHFGSSWCQHTDIKNEFYQRVKERGGPLELETQLRATISKLRATIDNKNRELNQLRADVPALVRVINQLTMENQQLRDRIVDPSGNVIPLPRRQPTL